MKLGLMRSLGWQEMRLERIGWGLVGLRQIQAVNLMLPVVFHGWNSRFFGHQRQLDAAVGSGALRIGFAVLHVHWHRVLQLYRLVLFGYDYGFGDSMEFHNGNPRCVLDIKWMLPSPTWNDVYHCCWRLDSINALTGSCLCDGRSYRSPPQRWGILLCPKILQPLSALCSYGFPFLVSNFCFFSFQSMVTCLFVINLSCE